MHPRCGSMIWLYRLGISNLVVDLLLAIIFLGVSTTVMAYVSHVTFEAKDRFNNGNLRNKYLCPRAWSLSPYIKGRILLIVANPYNISLNVKVLNLDNFSDKGIELVLNSNETKILAIPVGDVIIAASNGCVITPREVALP